MHMSQVLRALDTSRVLVISGETGCGKSTQVPQYLLEQACASGGGGQCSIVVTQPRRIAAIALAERVASERGGGKPGGVVGYSVRLESRVSAETRLLFCTTGVLLQKLRSDPSLRALSHVVIDEVHERSLDSDFLLIILRDALQANPKLRVVLMSATLHAGSFAAYFKGVDGVGGGGGAARAEGGAAMLSIPGRTFPIRDFFLEDAIEATGYVARGKILLRGEQADEELAFLEAAPQSHELAARAHELAAQLTPPTSDGADGADGRYSERTKAALQRMRAGEVPADLVARLLATLDERASAVEASAGYDGLPGAILLFLPGVPEIRRLHSELVQSPHAARWLLLSLHGDLPAAEQRKVFGRPPAGKRKVILSTNVAETSLTCTCTCHMHMHMSHAHAHVTGDPEHQRRRDLAHDRRRDDGCRLGPRQGGELRRAQRRGPAPRDVGGARARARHAHAHAHDTCTCHMHMARASSSRRGRRARARSTCTCTCTCTCT